MKTLQKFKTAFALAGALAMTAASGINGSEALERPLANDNSGKTPSLASTFAAQAHPAQKIIQNVSENMLSALKRDKVELKRNPNHIYTLLEKNLLPHIDFKISSKLVMAKYWRRATDEQRARFEKALRNVTVNTYAKALLMFDNEDVTVLPHRPSSRDDRAYIRTRIELDNGNDLAVDYAMYRNKNNEWKVYDLVVDGISFVHTYRNQFSYSVSRHGLDGAVQDMEKISGGMRYQKPPEKDVVRQQKTGTPLKLTGM